MKSWKLAVAGGVALSLGLAAIAQAPMSTAVARDEWKVKGLARITWVACGAAARVCNRSLAPALPQPGAP